MMTISADKVIPAMDIPTLQVDRELNTLHIDADSNTESSGESDYVAEYDDDGELVIKCTKQESFLGGE